MAWKREKNFAWTGEEPLPLVHETQNEYFGCRPNLKATETTRAAIEEATTNLVGRWEKET